MDCPRCGTKMEGRVCPNCGFPVIQLRLKIAKHGWNVRKNGGK